MSTIARRLGVTSRKGDTNKRYSFLNKTHHLLSLYIGVVNISPKETNFAQCYGEKHQFTHLEPISRNSGFMAGPQST